MLKKNIAPQDARRLWLGSKRKPGEEEFLKSLLLIIRCEIEPAFQEKIKFEKKLNTASYAFVAMFAPLVLKIKETSESSDLKLIYL